MSDYSDLTYDSRGNVWQHDIGGKFICRCDGEEAAIALIAALQASTPQHAGPVAEGCAATLPLVEAVSDERVYYRLQVEGMDEPLPLVMMFAANGTDKVNVTLEARYCDGADNCEPIPLYTHPTPDAADAARYRWLRDTMYAQDIVIGEARVVLDVTGACQSSAEFDAAIDAALASAGRGGQ
jgi:hypothetical protein